VRECEERINRLAANQHQLVTRGQVIESGGSDDLIKQRIRDGRWVARQAGVYQVDWRDQEWIEALNTAVLAGGPRSLVSHRAALVLWRMDGLSQAPVEITVPYSNRPIPARVIVHRTRRPMDHDWVQGLPVTSAERTLLDLASLVPRSLLAKAVESSLRLRLLTIDSVFDEMALRGGRGVRGSKKLKQVMTERIQDTSTDSGAESELIFHIRKEGIIEPELQVPLLTPSGRRIRPDFLWSGLGKAVEVDGLDAHSSADALDSDLSRQNELLEMGIELRRFSARQVRRNPNQVVDEIRRFLAS
jgi:very-short-patch-repair endonuclease